MKKIQALVLGIAVLFSLQAAADKVAVLGVEEAVLKSDAAADFREQLKSEFAGDETPGAFSEGGQQHHAGHPHRHGKQHQETAYPVAGNAAAREGENVAEPHGRSAPVSDSMRPSTMLILRRARLARSGSWVTDVSRLAEAS